MCRDHFEYYLHGSRHGVYYIHIHIYMNLYIKLNLERQCLLRPLRLLIPQRRRQLEQAPVAPSQHWPLDNRDMAMTSHPHGDVQGNLRRPFLLGLLRCQDYSFWQLPVPFYNLSWPLVVKSTSAWRPDEEVTTGLCRAPQQASFLCTALRYEQLRTRHLLPSTSAQPFGEPSKAESSLSSYSNLLVEWTGPGNFKHTGTRQCTSLRDLSVGCQSNPSLDIPSLLRKQV